MARKPLPARNRFNADGSVNPRSAKPSALTPYVGPSGANRPIGWGGQKWLQDNAKALDDPATVHKRFPEQFGTDGKVRQDYVPTPRGQQQKTGNVPKAAAGGAEPAYAGTRKIQSNIDGMTDNGGFSNFPKADAALGKLAGPIYRVNQMREAAGKSPAGGRLSGQQAQQFNQANHQYNQDHMQAHAAPEQPAGDGKRVGWGNKARAAAAQARGAKWSGPTE